MWTKNCFINEDLWAIEHLCFCNLTTLGSSPRYKITIHFKQHLCHIGYKSWKIKKYKTILMVPNLIKADRQKSAAPYSLSVCRREKQTSSRCAARKENITRHDNPLPPGSAPSETGLWSPHHRGFHPWQRGSSRVKTKAVNSSVWRQQTGNRLVCWSLLVWENWLYHMITADALQGLQNHAPAHGEQRPGSLVHSRPQTRSHLFFFQVSSFADHSQKQEETRETRTQTLDPPNWKTSSVRRTEVT